MITLLCRRRRRTSSAAAARTVAAADAGRSLAGRRGSDSGRRSLAGRHRTERICTAANDAWPRSTRLSNRPAARKIAQLMLSPSSS